MNNWNKNNVKWMILYAVLYAAGTAIVCGDTLMAVSPAWVLPVVIIVGIIASVIISNLTAKLFKLK